MLEQPDRKEEKAPEKPSVGETVAVIIAAARTDNSSGTSGNSNSGSGSGNSGTSGR